MKSRWARIVGRPLAMTAVIALLLGSVTASGTVSAPNAAAADQTNWLPATAPLPTAPLPDGELAKSDRLTSTSCSSPDFCVAVGLVSAGTLANGYSPSFPFAEVYSDGAWNPEVLPLPSNAISATQQSALLNSVSCASDGACAAVGLYSGTPPGSQYGLLEELSDGRWTDTAGSSPTKEAGDGADLTSVSCSSSEHCVAIGFGAPDGLPVGAIYSLDGGVWNVQLAPAPAGTLNLEMYGVSCPDDGDCVAVGSYQYNDPATGLAPAAGIIWTLASGIWTYSTAPLPANALSGTVTIGQYGYYQQADLNAVDCPVVGSCVAGGFYLDTSGSGDSLILEQQSGSWVPEEGPLPSDAQFDPPFTGSQITSVSCPTTGACVASGWYMTDWEASQLSGLLLTQDGPGIWSAAAAPLPSSFDSFEETSPTTSPTLFRSSPRLADTSQSSASLSGVSCAATQSCVAVGVDNGAGLIEASNLTTKPLVPWVTAVNSGSGPLSGGNQVAITGAYFSGTTRVLFGATAATHVHVVSAFKITATAPSHLAGVVHILVTTRGGTSAVSASNKYSYDRFQVSGSDDTLHANHGRHFAVTLTTLGAPVGATISWAKAGPLPASLRLTSSGLLSGTPLKAGTYAFSVTATAKVGHTSTSVTGKLTLIIG